MKTLTLILLILISSTFYVQASGKFEAVDVADVFFVNMKKNELCTLWGMLTEKSQNVISNDILKADDGENKLTKKQVFKDFENCGKITKSYWLGFLSEFDPDSIVNDAAWDIQEDDDREVKISLTYKSSKKPAILHMFFENKSWKVGLTESFWLRRFFD